MSSLLRLIRPMRVLRRKAIVSGLLGGNRKWLIWGGMAWALRGVRRLSGGVPRAVYTQELDPGERAVVLHNPASPRRSRRVRRRA